VDPSKSDSYTGICVGRYYRHVKTGGVYRVLAYPALLEPDDIAGPEHVVYESLSTNIVWIRIASEFFDGRFVDVTRDHLS
jgi:hypothetical protein